MKILQDPHYPRYHLAAPGGWMNDPHPIYFKGAYHMFYQYSFLPEDPYGAPHCWGHAVSRDLVHWEHMPPAITPKDHGIAADRHIWSGCLVDNQGVGTAIYTIDNLDIWTSTSTDDDLRVFKKHEANPIIKGPPPIPDILAEMRDPWVWKEPDGWYLTVGSGLKDNKGAVLPLYRSADLVHWQYLHPLYQGDPAKGDHTFCECPAFFPLGDTYVLTLSHGSTWMTGTFKDRRFQPEKLGRLNHGRFYVPQTVLDDKGRRILWAWATEARDWEAMKSPGWASMQTLPRVVSLAEDNSLRFDPAPELEVLRGAHHQQKDLTIGNTPVPVKGSQGMQLELRAVFAAGSAPRFGLALQDKTELIRITYDTVDKTLHFKAPVGARGGWNVYNANTSASDNKDLAIPLELEPGEALTLRVFLDRSVVEVFANRKVCITERIYPEDLNAVQASLFAEGGQAAVKQVDAWQMKSIW
jgi:beta-fructofuranosidase